MKLFEIWNKDEEGKPRRHGGHRETMKEYGTGMGKMERIRVRGRKKATESQSVQRVLERNYIKTGLYGPDFIEEKATDFFFRN